ncbi:MAG: hypothetical protein K0R50_1207 [Eubacterium sp.]|jgi:hypothetical protein|nr:hypothetical protein [Eubacterium sp.]
MAYRKRASKSRRYKRAHSNVTSHNEEHAMVEEKVPQEEIPASKADEAPSQERKKSQPLGFLSSLFGGDKAERSGNPLINIFDFDIYIDDLILAGLIILILTDKAQDEILLIVLVYLLLDIF